MPKCHECGVMLAPDLCLPDKEDSHRCLFCMKGGVTKVEIKNADGSTTVYDKDYEKRDYEMLMNKLASQRKENAAEQLFGSKGQDFKMGE